MKLGIYGNVEEFPQLKCFPTFFGSWHPYLVMKIFCGNLSLFHRYKEQVILKIGGTPGTGSRHPGWEPLA